MDFFYYMIINYVNANNPKGDLARDLAKAAKYYIENKVAWYSVQDTFEECWNEYNEYLESEE